MLLTVDDLRAQIETDRTDVELLAIAQREETMLVRKLGPHGDGVSSITETVDGHGGDLFLARPFVSIVSLGGAAPPLAALQLYPRQGRVGGAAWRGPVEVVYVPEDDRDARAAALVELVRLAVSRTALRAESVAGEYSYQAPDWEAARSAVYRTLRFTPV